MHCLPCRSSRRAASFLVCILISVVSAAKLLATDYYVSPTGDDSQTGAIDAPFRTLARAAQTLQPGDTCILRAGIYEEILRPENSGTVGQPITYRAYPGEDVLLSAMQALNGWELDAGSVYRTIVDWDLGQRNFVMHGETALDLARWPNNSDGDVWTLNSRRNTGGSGADVINEAYLDYATGIPDHDWSQGGSIFFYGDRPGSGWTAWKAFITGSTANRVTFELDKTQHGFARRTLRSMAASFSLRAFEKPSTTRMSGSSIPPTSPSICRSPVGLNPPMEPSPCADESRPSTYVIVIISRYTTFASSAAKSSSPDQTTASIASPRATATIPVGWCVGFTPTVAVCTSGDPTM